MASRLKVSFQAIEKYESGRAIIDEERLGRILKALELSVWSMRKFGKGVELGRRKK